MVVVGAAPDQERQVDPTLVVHRAKADEGQVVVVSVPPGDVGAEGGAILSLLPDARVGPNRREPLEGRFRRDEPIDGA